MDANPEIISASISDRGLSEKRPQNEDSFTELPEYGIFAVADGVGGAQAGDVASQMAMEILSEAVINRAGSSDPEDLFRVAIDHANRSIFQMASDLPQLASMATTIVALQLNGNIATIAHVGDSRLYRFSPAGELFRETQDHSVVEEEVRAGRMTPEEALVHPSRNVISRAVGAESTVDIDLKTMMVEPNTTFLLCSDGITRHVGDAELSEIFSSGAQPQLICEHLKELCFSRGAEDNLTAVIVRTFAETAEPAVDDFDATFQVLDEETIATARSPFDSPVEETEPLYLETLAGDANETIQTVSDEVETGEFRVEPEENILAEVQPVEVVEPADDDEAFLMQELDEEPTAEPEVKDLSSYTSSSVVVPAQAEPQGSDFAIFGSQTGVAYSEAAPARGGLGRYLMLLGFLVLGGVIGVAAMYFAGVTGPSYQVAPPQIDTMKSSNTPLTSFEELRRAVDRDPEGYLSKYAPSPQDASDYYLLGRALLLTGKNVEAKRQLTLAKEQLARVDEPERKTLATEIALAMSVIDNPQAAELFAKEIAAGKPSAGTNTNSAANANRPIR